MTIIHSFFFAIAILIPLSIGKVFPSILQIFVVLLISFTSVYLGSLLSNKLKVSEKISSPFAFNIIVGFSILSIAELILVHFLHFNPVKSFSIILIILAGLYLTEKGHDYNHDKAFSKLDLKQEAFNVGVLIFISVFTTVWCRELILSVENAHLTGIFRVWPDLFLHTNEIISLENYSHLNDQSLSLSGSKKSFYHFASYALPAFYASATNELAVVVATNFWTPIGIILMGLGVFVFATNLGGRFVGLISTIAVFLLPDASMYGLKIGFFGFHWLLQTSAGSGYAMALIFISLTLFTVGARESKFEYVLWSILAVILSAFFRVQLAAPALITMVILANFVWQPQKKLYRLAAYFFLLAAIISIIILFEKITFAPHFLSGQNGASKFFDVIHNKLALSEYASSSVGQIYIYFLSHAPTVLNWLIGYLIFLLASLGLLLPILIVLSISKLKPRFEMKINIIPFVMLIAGFIIIISLPIPPDGDYSNFGHRPFILYYATSIIFITYWLSTFFERGIYQNKLIMKTAVLITLTFTCLLIVVPYKFGKDIQQPKNWSDNITLNKIPSGLFNTTKFIRKNSKVNEIVLSSDLAPWSEVITLSERPAFISRERFHSNFNGQLKQDFFEKKKQFDAFEFVKSPQEFCRLANKNNIIWVLKFPDDFKNWPIKVLDMYIFKSDGFYVFNLSEKSCKNYLLEES